MNLQWKTSPSFSGSADAWEKSSSTIQISVNAIDIPAPVPHLPQNTQRQCLPVIENLASPTHTDLLALGQKCIGPKLTGPHTGRGYKPSWCLSTRRKQWKKTSSAISVDLYYVWLCVETLKSTSAHPCIKSNYQTFFNEMNTKPCSSSLISFLSSLLIDRILQQIKCCHYTSLAAASN